MPRPLAVFLLLPLTLQALPHLFEPSGPNYITRNLTLTPAGPIFAPNLRLTLPGAHWNAPTPDTPPAYTQLFSATSQTRLSQYPAIRYRALYPGIDLLFHDSLSGLEYDFLLAPHADPRALRLRFPNHPISLDHGDLVAGPLRHHQPLAWQDTPTGRHYIQARYLLRDSEVTFELGAYDQALFLTIDPVLTWSTFAGGSGIETGRAIAADPAGNVYLGGSTDSPDFTLLKGTPSTGPRGFVARLDSSGANVTASLAIAGATLDALALDASNAVIVAGSILSATFPATTVGAVSQPNPLGYVARFTQDASGFRLTFLAALAATPAALAVDSKGDIYLTGAAARDAIALKLSSDGARVIYSTRLGGSDQDTGRAIAVNSTGEAYIAGDTASKDFPITPGAAQSVFGGRVADLDNTYGDAFVAKLDSAGANLVFSTYLGGTAPDIAWAIAVNSAGEAFVAGGTQSSDFPVTAGAYQTKYGGGAAIKDGPDPAGDAFLVKFSPAGARLWSTFLGGSSREVAAAIALAPDTSGNIFAAGSSESADFPWTADAVRGCRTGGPWIAQLDSTGARLLRSTSIGGLGFDQGNALSLDARGAVYLAGETTSRPFFATGAAAQKSYGGGDSDAFAAKLDWQAAPRVNVSCVLNAASFAAGNFAFYPQGTVAPGEIVSIFGSALGPDVFFDGVRAPVFYTSPNQVNAIVPYSVKPPATQLTVQRDGVTDGPRLLPVAAAVPGIFTATQTGQGQAAVLNEDGTYNSPANPAPRGSIIVFYAVGAGAMNPPQTDGVVQPTTLPLPAPAAPVTVQIRGEEATVLYAGAAPGYIAGLLQVNVRVPDTIPFGNSVPLTLTIGGQPSQFNVTIAVR